MTLIEKKIKSLEEIKDILREHKKELETKYPISSIGIFGSYVRGEQKKKSDVDILVDFKEPVSFFEFIHLENDIRGLIGVKVDLVAKKALKPYIGKQILEEVIYL